MSNESPWTEADEQQAAAMAEIHEAPSDCCTECGDGTEDGRELCRGCEREKIAASRPMIPGDNWRASNFRRRR